MSVCFVPAGICGGLNPRGGKGGGEAPVIMAGGGKLMLGRGPGMTFIVETG